MTENYPPAGVDPAVLGDDSNERINCAMSLPKRLRTEDGRELLITEWEPSATVGDAVRVTLRAIVCVPSTETGGST